MPRLAPELSTTEAEATWEAWAPRLDHEGIFLPGAITTHDLFIRIHTCSLHNIGEMAEVAELRLLRVYDMVRTATLQ